MSMFAFAVAAALSTAPTTKTASAPAKTASPMAAAAATDTEGDDDAADGAPPSDKDSEELEAMRALEEVTLDPHAKANARALQALNRLGLTSPLREALTDGLDEGDADFSALPVGVPRITDLVAFDVKTVAHEYDIPVEMQPLVAQYIQFFQGPGRKWFRKWMGRSTKYIPMMAPILEGSGVPKDLVYLSMIESGFSTSALSWAKAAGPWQFIPGTAKLYGLKADFWVDERRDPVKSTGAAARYLRRLNRDFGDWYLAWAGYNAGGERVRKLVVKRETKNFWELSDGKGFAKETRHYVPKLIACALVAKHPHAFGFTDAEFEFENPAEWDEVKIVDPTDLEVVARAAEVDVDAVKDLNPELRRWCTPPATSEKPYVLRVPKGGGEKFATNFPKIAPRERLTFKVHHIRRGDTLSQIARLYRSAPEAILALNQLKNARTLRVNSDLVIPVAPGKNGGAEGSPIAASVERQAVKARRGGFVASRPEEEIPAGTPRAPAVQGPVQADIVDGKAHLRYGVASGDTLWSISQRFDCPLDALRSWNHLGAHAKGLQVGKILSIFPGPHAAPVANASGTLVAVRVAPQNAAVASNAPVAVSPKTGARTHQLAAGETLWSVAQRYGISVEDLKRWNGIKQDRSVRAGQALVLGAP